MAGAAVLFGAVAAAAVSTLAADRVAEPEFMRRLAFRSLLIVGLPAYIVMRVGAEWLYSKGFDELGRATPRGSASATSSPTSACSSS